MLDVGETIENIATIDSPDKLTDLYKLITNPSRQLPVIVISENTSLDNISAKYFAVNDSYLLDGTCLAEDLKFISHIFYLPSEYQTSWCNLIGSNWGLYNGAVRTYYPILIIIPIFRNGSIIIFLVVLNFYQEPFAP